MLPGSGEHGHAALPKGARDSLEERRRPEGPSRDDNEARGTSAIELGGQRINYVGAGDNPLEPGKLELADESPHVGGIIAVPGPAAK